MRAMLALRSAVLVPALLLAACTGDPKSPRVPATPPHVAGLDVLAGTTAKGRVLLHTLRCVACHAAPEVRLDPAPSLSNVSTRLSPDYVVRFLADPHGTEPGTVMPAVAPHRSDQERKADAAAITAFLFEDPAAVEAASLGAGPEVVAEGRIHYERLGCAACHAPLDGPDGDPTGSAPLADLGAKYTREGLRAFLLDPLEHRPAGRMPDMRLDPAEAHALSVALGAKPGTASVSGRDPQLVARGRARFEELGCAACHDGVTSGGVQPARTLASLDPASTTGCLSGVDGSWPAYDLDDAQRDQLRAALAAPATPDDEDGTAEILAARQCFACHARAGRGGVTAARDRFFTTEDERTGSASRLPPPLDHVGEKLTPAWLQKAIAHGQEQRAYVTTRMPGFGAALAAELAPRLTAADAVADPEFPALPDGDEERRAVRDLGMNLVGDRGLNCIACHTFGGESVGAMAAIDLAATTGERLTRGFFHRYLLEPTRYRPDTLMPTFFAGGKSPLPELADGDITRQIDAMWTYLAEGRNTRRPPGLRSPPVVLEVGDRPVILRRRLQRTGKRGISVGLPGGVNFAFDAETIALHQVWWGEFLDASPVFHGQGSGEARILGRDLAVLPVGPTVVAALGDGEAWPTATRRELGQELGGYDLDAGGHPTFRYALPGVAIEDAPRPDAQEGARTDLVRKLRLTPGEGAPERVFVLLARDAKLVADGASFRVGERLGIQIVGADPIVVSAGEAQELRVAVPLGTDPIEVSIRYSFLEEGR
jgi:mono/diheme cytochrome c family protein